MGTMPAIQQVKEVPDVSRKRHVANGQMGRDKIEASWEK
jgi:hypothetical protein